MNMKLKQLKHLARRDVPSKAQAAKILGTSRPTAYVWLDSPQELKIIKPDTLIALLTDVYGIPPAEVANLRLGDVFDLEA